MTEKQFRVRFEQEDDRGEIVNEKGVELTAREVVDLLNNQQEIIKNQYQKIKVLTKIILKMLIKKLKECNYE